MKNFHLSILTLTLAAQATAWSVAFYSGQNCNADSSFNNVNYEGFSQGVANEPYSDCVVVGDPVDGCSWYTDNASNGPFACTGPMSPAPGSVYIPPNSECVVTWGRGCVWPPWPLPSDTCYQIGKLPNGYHDTVVSFKCRASS